MSDIIGSLFLEMILHKTLPFLEQKSENLKNLVISVGLLSKKENFTYIVASIKFCCQNEVYLYLDS